MLNYEIREICGDWAIYEVWETETEGGERCLLILNSRANAEYVKVILEHEARYSGAAVPYAQEVAEMSDEEVVVVYSLCSSEDWTSCSICPLYLEDGICDCTGLKRRILDIAKGALGGSHDV